MTYLYKIISTKLPPYLYEIIPSLQMSHRHLSCFQTLCCRTALFHNLLLLFTITEWNKFNSHAMFRKNLLAFVRPQENDTYGIYDPLSVRLLNRMILGFSHLREHKFRPYFTDTLNSLSSCSLETEDTKHYFLRCQNNVSLCATLINDLNNINTAITSLNPNDRLSVILYGNKRFNKEINCKILTASIKF